MSKELGYGEYLGARAKSRKIESLKKNLISDNSIIVKTRAMVVGEVYGLVIPGALSLAFAYSEGQDVGNVFSESFLPRVGVVVATLAVEKLATFREKHNLNSLNSFLKPKKRWMGFPV